MIQHKYNQDVLQTEPRQRSASLRGLSKKDKEKLKITKTESEKKRGFGLMNIFRKRKKKPEEATPKQQRPNHTNKHKKELTFRQQAQREMYDEYVPHSLSPDTRYR